MIQPAGLAHRSERLAYYRPLTDTPFVQGTGLIAISGFGVDVSHVADGSVNSLADFRKWTALDLYVLVSFVVVLPTLVLLLLAVRSNAERRDRRLALLDSLGAPASARAWVLAGEAALPTCLGAALGALLGLAGTYVDIHLPITGYIVGSDDLAAVRPLLAPTAAAVVVCSVGLVVLMQLRGRAKGETRPRLLRQRFNALIQAIFPLSLVVAVWGATTARSGDTRYSVGLIAFLIGTGAVLASLPSVLSAGAARAGRLIARLGAAAGSSGAVVGGRWLAARPAMVGRLCAAFVVGLGLLVQVQVQQDWIIERTRGFAGESLSGAVGVGDSLIVVRTPADASGAARFTQLVGTGNVVQVIEVADNRVLIGSCAALGKLGRLHDCAVAPQPMLSAYAELNSAGNVVRTGTLISDANFTVATMAPPPGGKTVGFFVTNREGRAGLERIAAAAYANLTKPYVSTPGQHWISGGLAGAAVFDWVLLTGLVGLVILALAGALASAGMFLAHARSLGVLGTYDSHARLYLSVASWNLGVPLVAAGIVGSATAAFLGYLSLQIRRVGSVSFVVLGAGFATVAVLAAALTIICGLVAARSVRTWHPVAD
jgi:hypothetical protein